MKKGIAILLCVALAMTFTACSGKTPSDDSTTTTTTDLVTTTTEEAVTTTTEQGDTVTTTTETADATTTKVTATTSVTAATTTKKPVTTTTYKRPPEVNTTAKPTTTTKKPTTTTVPTTKGRAEIKGNVWTLEYQDVDGVVYVDIMDFANFTMRSLACIPWDEAFSYGYWQMIKQDEPESVYVYGGAEYYIDASATYPLSVDFTTDSATLFYTRADNANVRMTVTRSGGRALQVVGDTSPTGSRIGKTFYCK
jgi:hypothetical protein